ncbi:ABC transporter substrate-binding protein [Nocardioides sp. AE5]|uniref:ABC transporter substrate-binding protein n=1 Tax=Nocardioides sp. AE5 TaxID=2962573 RepID=UPI00288220F3|nr:ABC transporter substrate-binding protein [Nocardioides sp. AE5]MDT0203186.1 ABC transporter substrate-binding protein [Nocardioides sp. AE5]
MLNSRKRWSAGVAAALLAGAVALAGCSTPADTERAGDEPVPGGTLKFVVSADANGFDPQNDTFSGQTNTMARTILEPLTILDAEGNWQPYLAESVEPNDDATEWTIVLRGGINFSNGDVLDADVVAKNLEGHRTKPVNAGTLADIESITVAGERTVVVSMARPWATFPMYLTTQIGLVVPEESLENPDEASANPIGTGPFLFGKHLRDSSLTVEKNPDYWRADEGLPYLDGIEFRIIPDDEARGLALESGNVAGISTRDAKDVAKFKDDADYIVTRTTGMAVPESVYVLNTAQGALQDESVRRALAAATDRQTIIDVVREGLTEPASGPWSEDSPWYVESDYPDFDLEAAQSAIAEYEAAHGQIELTLMTLADASALQTAQLVQDMWKKAGVDLTIDQLDQGTLIDRLIKGNYDISSMVEFSAPDPDMERLLFHGATLAPIGEISPNITRIDEELINDGFDRGRASIDEAERKDAYAQVQRRLGEIVPIIWIDHLSTASIITSASVGGVGQYELPSGQMEYGPYGNPSPALNFHAVWIVDQE